MFLLLSNSSESSECYDKVVYLKTWAQERPTSRLGDNTVPSEEEMMLEYDQLIKGSGKEPF